MEIIYGSGGNVLLMTLRSDLGCIAGEAPSPASPADGRVTLDNVPGVAEVNLLLRDGFILKARQFSHSDGTYRFVGLPIGTQYDVVGRDPSGEWEDVIVGRVLPFIPLTISGNAPEYAVGSAYYYQYLVTGGEAPYTYSLSGSLPSGLSLSASGVISGVPDADAGVVEFTVTVVDARGAVAIVADTISSAQPRMFWRIAILAGNGDSYSQIWEMRLRAEDGGLNLAVGGVASASSFYSGGYVAAMAFDGSEATRWCSTSSDSWPRYLGYQLSAPAAINQIEIVAGAETPNDAPRDFVVQKSVDGVEWHDEWEVAGQTGWSIKETRVFNRP